MRAVSPFALSLLMLAACTSPGDYPSLAKRPFETGIPPAAAPVQPTAPQDAALRQRIEKRVQQAESSVAPFEAALARARAAVSGAGSVGSEGWISAQLELSRLEVATAPAREALAALDDERRLLMGAGNADDLALLEAAIARVEGIDAAQSSATSALASQIKGN